ncbi:hypothetical protein I3842_12G035300 [Carya illinoinensis]|uniref:AMP-dependent synthetase/ligase domain-containing protein n=1 Tax=Carya illinoinensis TaxID=32201 RepID=A0A922DGF8_CARIL|nr:hypothetical protein I3842_12G035300 [Carya illinoinensis]
MEDEATFSGFLINPSSGFYHKTKIFHSLRPWVPLPPPSQPLSIAQFCFSLLQSSSSTLGSTTVLIDSSTSRRLCYSEFLDQIHSLAIALKTSTSLSKGHVAFILAPSSLQVPVLYFALLTLGVTVSPANLLSSEAEIAHQVLLCKPVIAFAPSSTSDKLSTLPLVQVSQLDSAAILYSSGTTGRVKGIVLVHGNLITLIAGFFHLQRESDQNQNQPQPQPQPVSMFTLPLFHVFGFFMLVRAVTMAETLVLMGRFNFESMLRAVVKYRVTYMLVSPPLVVVLAKSDLANKYDLSSLQLLGFDGAPLGKEVAKHFAAKFPNVMIVLVAPYKKIHRVSFINSIPKSPAGKILRRELITHATSLGSSRL